MSTSLRQTTFPALFHVGRRLRSQSSWASEQVRSQIPFWESIRRNLYRAVPETEQAVKLVDRGAGKMQVDCGCKTGEHTCSDYYLCGKHSGWDHEIAGSKTYYYKCLAGVPVEGSSAHEE